MDIFRLILFLLISFITRSKKLLPTTFNNDQEKAKKTAFSTIFAIFAHLQRDLV